MTSGKSVGDLMGGLYEVLNPGTPIFPGDFDKEDGKKLEAELNRKWGVPHVGVQVSQLGPSPTIMVTVSLDPKSTWKNGIFHNSRGMMFSVYPNGVIEQFYYSVRDPKTLEPLKKLRFRKRRVKSLDEFVKKVGDYLQKVKKEVVGTQEEAVGDPITPVVDSVKGLRILLRRVQDHMDSLEGQLVYYRKGRGSDRVTGEQKSKLDSIFRASTVLRSTVEKARKFATDLLKQAEDLGLSRKI